MELTEQQKDTVRKWVQAGASLSDVQKRIASELGVAMTYMDVRFLVIDLGVNVRDKPAPVPPPAAAPKAVPSGGGAAGDADDLDEQAFADEPPHGAGPSRVKVEVDRIMKPGAVASGSVTFSDGVSGAWSLDQYGRLALSATPGYQPNRDDVMAFQVELQKVLRRQGY